MLHLSDSSITFTKALPTTAASAFKHISSICDLLETPKPTATGKSVNFLILSTRSSPRDETSVRAPVTPVTLSQYTKPSHFSNERLIFLSVLVGAIRGMKLTSDLLQICLNS